jgi:hypothetical protein
MQAALGEALFTAVWLEGQALPLEQAMIHALEEGARSDRASSAQRCIDPRLQSCHSVGLEVT